MTILIVNWNHSGLLRDCLTNLAREGLVGSVLLIDNGSSDDSLEVAQTFGVRTIALSRNVGYGAANDVGLRSTEDELVVFLNTDAFPSAKDLDELFEVLDRRPEVAAVGPALIGANGEFQSGGAGFGPSVGAAFSHFIGWGHVLGRHGHPLLIRQQAYSKLKTVNVGWLAGACLVARRSAVVSAGGFGSRYFMYAEDADLCMRLRARGWSLVYIPPVKVQHNQGSSGDSSMDSMWLDSLRELYSVHFGRGAAKLFKFAAVSGLVLRLALSIEKTRRKRLVGWLRRASAW